MTTLLLLFAAPMQAWGVRSASERKRDTARHPSRSGVIGFLAACQGLDRTQPLDWAHDLTIQVRADRPGHVMTDYHTVGGGYPAKEQMRSGSGARRDDAVITLRDYLTDAAFVIAVTGNSGLIEDLAAAVRAPRYTPFLGRKSCPPALPVLLGVTDLDPITALGQVPAYHPAPRADQEPDAVGPKEPVGLEDLLATDVTFDDYATASHEPDRITCLIHTENPTHAVATLNDVPISFNHWGRVYGSRSIGEATVQVPPAGTGIDAVEAMRAALAHSTETPR